MDEAEREIWCKAWRLLLLHGDETGHFIDTEIARLLHRGDNEAVATWQQVADAVEKLAN